MLAHLDSIYVTFKRPRSRVKVQGCHGYCTAWIVNFHNAGDIWWMRLNYIGNVLSLGISGWCNLKWVTAFLAWYPATKRVLKFLTAIILYCYNICRRWIGFCQFTQWFFDFHKNYLKNWNCFAPTSMHILDYEPAALYPLPACCTKVVDSSKHCFCCSCVSVLCWQEIQSCQLLSSAFFKFCVMQLLQVCCIQIFVLLWLVSFANVPSCHTSTMHFVANYFH